MHYLFDVPRVAENFEDELAFRLAGHLQIFTPSLISHPFPKRL